MTKLEKLIEDCQWHEHGFLVADGFNQAIVGIEVLSGKVVYDVGIMANILTEDEEMTIETAIEYLEYNVINAFVGDNTPIYINVVKD